VILQISIHVTISLTRHSAAVDSIDWSDLMAGRSAQNGSRWLRLP